VLAADKNTLQKLSYLCALLKLTYGTEIHTT
jgi:hypothetical protein